MRYFKVASTIVFGLFWSRRGRLGPPRLQLLERLLRPNRFPDPVNGQRVYDPAGAFDPPSNRPSNRRSTRSRSAAGPRLRSTSRSTRPPPKIQQGGRPGAARRVGGRSQGFRRWADLADQPRVQPRAWQGQLLRGRGLPARLHVAGRSAERDRRGDRPGRAAGAAGRRDDRAIEVVDTAITPEGTDRLNLLRQLNAALGLIGAPITFLVIVGFAFFAWRREGNDPEVLDSDSILMAGPPADMTPPLATVVRHGRRPNIRWIRC